jgi:hypothetical protein
MGLRWINTITTMENENTIDLINQCKDFFNFIKDKNNISLLEFKCTKKGLNLVSFKLNSGNLLANEEINYRKFPEQVKVIFNDIKIKLKNNSDNINLIKVGEKLINTCWKNDPQIGFTYYLSKAIGRAYYFANYESVGYSSYLLFEYGSIISGKLECGYFGNQVITIDKNQIEIKEIEENIDNYMDPFFNGTFNIVKNGIYADQMIYWFHPIKSYSYNEYIIRKDNIILDKIEVIKHKIK